MPSNSQGLKQEGEMKRTILSTLGAATIAAILCLPFAVWDYQATKTNTSHSK